MYVKCLVLSLMYYTAAFFFLLVKINLCLQINVNYQNVNISNCMSELPSIRSAWLKNY